MSNFDH